MSTINISLPVNMYNDAKMAVGLRGYASISELIRDALRDVLYPEVTENGFTPEFEEEVLQAASEPIENSVEWDGKTPFVEFVRTHPPKNAQNKVHQSVLRAGAKTSGSGSRARIRYQRNNSTISKESKRYAIA